MRSVGTSARVFRVVCQFKVALRSLPLDIGSPSTKLRMTTLRGQHLIMIDSKLLLVRISYRQHIPNNNNAIVRDLEKLYCCNVLEHIRRAP